MHLLHRPQDHVDLHPEALRQRPLELVARLRPGDDGVARGQHGSHIGVAGLLQQRAQIRHRDPPLGAQIDPPQQRDEPCHGREGSLSNTFPPT
jgi:hypothetical protein